MRIARQQGGWALIVVLIALAIVGYLARDSLVRLVMPLKSTAATASRVPPAASGGVDAVQAVAVPATAVERARAVEDTMHQQFERKARAIDAAR